MQVVLIIAFILVGAQAMGVKPDGTSASILSGLAASSSSAMKGGSGGAAAAGGVDEETKTLLIIVTSRLKKMINDITQLLKRMLEGMDDIAEILMQKVEEKLQEGREQHIHIPEFITLIPEHLSLQMRSRRDMPSIPSDVKQSGELKQGGGAAGGEIIVLTGGRQELETLLNKSTKKQAKF